MADNRKDKDRRFYMGRGQLVILGVGFTAASVIIFLLGILIGKVIEERKFVKKEEPLVKIPVRSSSQTASSAGGAQAKEELTFYDTLTKAPQAQPPAQAEEKESKRPEKTARAEIKEATPATGESDSAARKAAVKTGEKSAPVSQALRESPAASQKDSSNTWTVQVNAFPDERRARIWVDRLIKKGYKAYMVEAQIRERTWYRVRVGHYGTREDAEKAEEVLKSKENLTKSFATSR